MKEPRPVTLEGHGVRLEPLAREHRDALAKAAAGDTAEAVDLARQAVQAARNLGIPGLVTMTLVRAAQVGALADSPARSEIDQVLLCERSGLYPMALRAKRALDSQMAARILVIDDEPVMQRLVSRALPQIFAPASCWAAWWTAQRSLVSQLRRPQSSSFLSSTRHLTACARKAIAV